MKKIWIIIGIAVLCAAVATFVALSNRKEKIATVEETPTPGVITMCYKYEQLATEDAPYAVTEYVSLMRNGSEISGAKQGFQSGPGVSNGYTGTIEGSIEEGTITSVLSYTVEGSDGKEQEIYRETATGLEKLRYPLKEGAILTPDTTKPFKALQYATVECDDIPTL